MTATLPTRTAVTTCAVPGRPHQAESGSQLCRNHLDELGEWLHEVEHEVDRLDPCPSLQINWNGSRGGSLASHQIPARVDAIVHSDRRHVPLGDLTGLAGLDDTLSAFHTLYRWAQMVRNARDLKLPGFWCIGQLRPGPLCERECRHSSCRNMTSRYFKRKPLDVGTERQVLSRHLDWIAEQSWAGDVWVQVKKLRSQLQAANGTSDPKIHGRCPVPVAGAECGGRLQAVKPRHSSGTFAHVGEYLVEAVECETNPSHRWEEQHLIRLALILEEQQAACR